MACEKVASCPCPKTQCPRNRRCCECVVNHRNKGDLPFCLKQENKKEASQN